MALRGLAVCVLFALCTACGSTTTITPEEAERFNRLVVEANALSEQYVWLEGRPRALPDRGKLERAVALYDEALGIYPESWQTFVLRGKTQQALIQPEQALLSFREAYRLNPNDVVVVYAYVGGALEANRPQEVLKVARRSVVDFPEETNFRTNLATVLILVGRADEAIRQASMVLRVRPGDRIAARLLLIASEIKSGLREQPNSVADLTRR
ncbi:hypothetical protein [Pelagibius sp.]|uniref:hypothetical protein n=1 Tax=Pelagibius sp. TaxID=1931238 RepID=UPI00262B25A9|nr:hypothetical protein [Pelagibius sp.]